MMRNVLVACLLAVFAIPATLAQAHDLPLGDGKISSSPKAGYLMSCVTRWRRPVMHGGPWINGNEWNPARKPSVQGRVSWPASRIRIRVQGNQRVIVANNLPDHTTGIFPIEPSDPAYRYDHNPNPIRPQNILLHLPLHPEVAAKASCVPMGMIGFTTDGVAIYNAVDNGGADAVAHEVQDHCNGHPQHDGQYHYHGPSPCMPNEKTSGLVGYALDGFGIYGMRDRTTGRIVHDSDLDACHGTTSPVLWNGRIVDIYHYVLTQEYPYTVGCFRGTPVSTDFSRRQLLQMHDMGSGIGVPGNSEGRSGILDRAAAILGISARKLRSALGPPPPDLSAAAGRLGISPRALRAALRQARAGNGDRHNRP